MQAIILLAFCELRYHDWSVYIWLMFLDFIVWNIDQMFNVVKLESALSGLCFSVYVLPVICDLRPARKAMIHDMWKFWDTFLFFNNMTCQKATSFQVFLRSGLCFLPVNLRFLLWKDLHSKFLVDGKWNWKSLGLKGLQKIFALHYANAQITYWTIRVLVFWFLIEK